jgi:hypothetical protein
VGILVNQILGGPEIEGRHIYKFQNSIIDEGKNKKKSELHKLHL